MGGGLSALLSPRWWLSLLTNEGIHAPAAESRKYEVGGSGRATLPARWRGWRPGGELAVTRMEKRPSLCP